MVHGNAFVPMVKFDSILSVFTSGSGFSNARSSFHQESPCRSGDVTLNFVRRARQSPTTSRYILCTSFCPQLRTRILLLMPATTGSSKSKIWNVWCRILRPGDGKTTGWATRLESFQIFNFYTSTESAHQAEQLLLRRHSYIYYSVAGLLEFHNRCSRSSNLFSQ